MPPERCGDALDESLDGHGTVLRAAHAKKFEAPRPLLDLESEHPRDLGVVADLLMRIKRQVIGDEIDVVLQERLEAALLHADHFGALALPEPTMVHENAVRPHAAGMVDERLACADAKHDAMNFGLSLDREGRSERSL